MKDGEWNLEDSGEKDEHFSKEKTWERWRLGQVAETGRIEV